MSIDDISVLYSWLLNAHPKWFNFGLALGVGYNALEVIRGKNIADNTENLREMLALRLKMSLPLDMDLIFAALNENTVDLSYLVGHIKQKGRYN